MKPVKFKGHNIVFAENQPEYLPLPAFKSDEGVVVTCWELTFKERVKAFLTGRFYFQQLTFNSPLQPQLPSIENPLVFPKE